jgi:hypothetical protein
MAQCSEDLHTAPADRPRCKYGSAEHGPTCNTVETHRELNMRGEDDHHVAQSEVASLTRVVLQMFRNCSARQPTCEYAKSKGGCVCRKKNQLQGTNQRRVSAGLFAPLQTRTLLSGTVVQIESG